MSLSLSKYYFLADFKHISCQMVGIQDGIHLSTPQGALSTIISGPFHANEAKDKCIDVANALNYTYIGVMGGYCISAMNLTDYNSVPVYDQCEDGTGKYDPSTIIQYMDVYRIITRSGNQQHGSTKPAPQSTSGALPNTRFNVSHLFITLLFLRTLIMIYFAL